MKKPLIKYSVITIVIYLFVRFILGWTDSDILDMIVIGVAIIVALILISSSDGSDHRADRGRM